MSCGDLIALMGVIATTVLTVVIIVHGIRLGRKQTELQKRQLRIDERPYLERMYRSIYKMLGFVESLELFPKSTDEFAKIIADKNGRKQMGEIIRSISERCSILSEVQIELTVGQGYVSEEFAPILDSICHFAGELHTIFMRFFIGDGFVKEYLEKQVSINNDDGLEKAIKNVHDYREKLLGFVPALLEIEAHIKGITLNELQAINRRVYGGDK